MRNRQKQRALRRAGIRREDEIGPKNAEEYLDPVPAAAVREIKKEKDVRAERLQKISGSDCVAEGCDAEMLSEVGEEFTRGVFHGIWDSTIKKKDLPRCGWDANPWVWVYEFERIEGGAK